MAHPIGGGYDSWVALYWIILWTVLLGSSLYLPILFCRDWPEVNLDTEE